MTIKDETIETDVSDAIYWDNRIDASNIIVEVANGVVTLSGEAGSFFQKQSAEEVALNVEGVTGIINDIFVKYAHEVPEDEDIKIFAEKVIGWNSYLDASRIRVSINDGVLTLEGEVDTYWKHNRAVKLVSELDGVVDVENELAVVPTNRLVDQVVAEDVIRALDQLKIIDIDEIIVVVMNGEVTLNGTAPSWWARYRAYTIAGHVLGVTGVVNNLGYLKVSSNLTEKKLRGRIE